MMQVYTEKTEEIMKMNGRLGAREKLDLQGRVNKWIWKVFGGFNMDGDQPIGNKFLHQLTGGYCKIRLGIVQISVYHELEAAFKTCQRQFLIENTEGSKEGQRSDQWVGGLLMMWFDHIKV